MARFKHPVIGQEAVVPGYGLGRVKAFRDAFPYQSITVQPYMLDYAMDFAPENVKLVEIRYEAEPLPSPLSKALLLECAQALEYQARMEAGMSEGSMRFRAEETDEWRHAKTIRTYLREQK